MNTLNQQKLLCPEKSAKNRNKIEKSSMKTIKKTFILDKE
jgi:hypothetical protein